MGGSSDTHDAAARTADTSLVRTLAPETGRLFEAVNRRDRRAFWRRTLVEILVVYLVLGAFEALLFEGSVGSFGVHPHPYWLVILPAAAARGLSPGLFAAALGTLLYGVGVLTSPGAAGVTSLLDILTMREPILFFAVAYIVGELREGIETRLHKLGAGWTEIESAVERLVHERDVLSAANRELERRIVEHPGQVTSLLHSAARLGRTEPESVFDVALELVEEHCGARASVVTVARDGHLSIAAPRDLSGDAERRRIDLVRGSDLCARAVRLSVCVDGLRDGAPGDGPLCVAPLLDGQGFVLALLCLDEVPTTHLNEGTARVFFGVADWISASLSRLERGAAPLGRHAVFEFTAPVERTLGTPVELGERLRVETERFVRHGLPFSVLGIKSKSADTARVERSLIELLGPDLRATDGLYAFGYPGCFVVCLAATSLEAAQTPLLRSLEVVAQAVAAERFGPLELFVAAPEHDARDAVAFVSSLARRLNPAPLHNLRAPCPTDLSHRVGDVSACERRLDLETRLAQRLATELAVVEIGVDGHGELLARGRIEPELARLVRRADGTYAVDEEHLLIVLPETGEIEARLIARRFEAFLCDELGARPGSVRTHVRRIDLGIRLPSSSFEDRNDNVERLAVA